jgi:hypothetical protein
MLICPSVGKHSRPRRSWGPNVITGIALEAVAIFGFVYATDSDMSPPNLLVNNKVSTLAAPQTATPPVTQSALAGDDKPVIEEKKTEPAADKLTTDTGANKVEPATKAKTRCDRGICCVSSSRRSRSPRATSKARAEYRSDASGGYPWGDRQRRIWCCRLTFSAYTNRARHRVDEGLDCID